MEKIIYFSYRERENALLIRKQVTFLLFFLLVGLGLMAGLIAILF
jgi:hypothetical protein